MSIYYEGQTGPDITIKTQDIVRGLGVKTTLTGYTYICDAVVLAIEDHNRCSALTSQIYSVISERYHVTPKSVERSIRTAIEKAWQRDEDKIRDFFSDSDEGPIDKKPTNGEFISWLALSISRRLSVEMA
ncbi:MAG: sporulation initiation factor Spo0A C-terminal domain-containing protein [Eubacteriales bacterium]|nr:sporulation initiation factor Spo0A C-terminal domain-containing protein [Eubacteriales bacterium]